MKTELLIYLLPLAISGAVLYFIVWHTFSHNPWTGEKKEKKR